MSQTKYFKTRLTVILGLFVILTDSCLKTSKFKPEELILKKVKSITQFNDSTFLSSMVLCIDKYKDSIMLTDYKQGQIFMLNSELNLLSKIGIMGQGPGEMIGAAHFCVSNEKITVINDGKELLSEYSLLNKNFTKDIKFPKDLRKTLNTRFFEYDGKIFHSIVSEDSMIVAIDKNNLKSSQMGVNSKWDKPNLRMHSTRHLIKGNQSFYEIGCTLPILQEYSFEGEMLHTFDLSTIHDISKQMEIYKKNNQIPNTYFVMIQDVYFDNENIFLLFASQEVGYSCNKIIVINTQNEFKHIATYILSGGKVYLSFCVDNNRIIAFNGLNSNIDIYNFINNK